MDSISLDIHSAVQAATVLAILGLLLCVWLGIRSIRKAHTLRFFRMRRDRMVRGWRLLFFAVVLGVLALLFRVYAEPIAYSFFPPTPTATHTPTITLTPTITVTPSITLTPTITLTPSITDTPTATPTPQIPSDIGRQFESTVTPNPGAVFSDLVFSQGIDETTYLPLNANTVFQNPVGHMYALFSYDAMVNGSQWTALWYWQGELVYFESKPWDGGSGGFGYTDWEPEPYKWQPGEYEVQIFNGLIWKVSGRFTVEGEAPPAPPSPTASRTPTLTATAIPSRTPTPTATPTATFGPSPTPRPPTATVTPLPSRTPSITPTRWPTATPASPTPTRTRWPTAMSTTLTPTITRHPTFTPTP